MSFNLCDWVAALLCMSVEAAIVLMIQTKLNEFFEANQFIKLISIRLHRFPQTQHSASVTSANLLGGTHDNEEETSKAVPDSGRMPVPGPSSSR